MKSSFGGKTPRKYLLSDKILNLINMFDYFRRASFLYFYISKTSFPLWMLLSLH